ncbi:uncharacterized protein TNCV_1147771 [Trichonephila clavipes]|nr:uncharacterized protein TNCV_1147771 [Trichonephila clavipes]
MLGLALQGCYKTVSAMLLPFLGLPDPQICLQSSISGIIWEGELGIPRKQIKCPPLQLLPPLSSVPQTNAFPSIPSVSTSSYTTQANILPSASSIKPTTQFESRLPEPISSAAAPDNSLNTSASSLSAETRLLTTTNKFAALSTEIQPLVPLPESVPTTSNSEH